MAKAPKPPPNNVNLDPKSINSRLYNQVDLLLKDLEEPRDDDEPRVTLKERLAVLLAIGRLQAIFVALRKEKRGDDPDRAGSAVRKYSQAFVHDAGRGAPGARSAPVPAAGGPDGGDDDAGIDDDSDYDTEDATA